MPGQRQRSNNRNRNGNGNGSVPPAYAYTSAALKSSSLIPASVVSKYSSTQLKPLTTSAPGPYTSALSPTEQLAPTIQPPQIHPEPAQSYASSIGEPVLTIHEDTNTYSNTSAINTTQLPTPTGSIGDNGVGTNAGGFPAQQQAETQLPTNNERQSVPKKVEAAASKAANNVQQRAEEAADSVKHAAERVTDKLPSLPAATDVNGRPVGDVQSQPPNVAQHAQLKPGDISDPVLDQYKDADHPHTQKIVDAVDKAEAAASNQLQHAKQTVQETVHNVQHKQTTTDVASSKGVTAHNVSSTASDAAVSAQQRTEEAVHSVEHAAERVTEKLPSMPAATDASGRPVGDIVAQPPNVAQHAQLQPGDVSDPVLDTYKNADHPTTRKIVDAVDNAQASASKQLEHANQSVQEKVHNVQRKQPTAERTSAVDSTFGTIQRSAEQATQSVKQAANKLEAKITATDNSQSAAPSSTSKVKQTIVDAGTSITQVFVDGQRAAQGAVQSARETVAAATESIKEQLPASTSEAKAQLSDATDKATTAAKAKADDVVNRRVPELVSQFETIAHVTQQDVKHMYKQPSPVKHATPLETELSKQTPRDDATAPALPTAEVEHIAHHQEISESQATAVAPSGTSVETASLTEVLASQPDERQPEVNLLSETIKQQQSIGESVSADPVLPANNATQDAKTMRRIALQNIHRAREINAGFDEDVRKDSVDAIPVLHQTLLERHRSSNAEARAKKAETVDADLNSTDTASVVSHSLTTTSTTVTPGQRSNTHTFFASSIGRRLRQLLMFSLTGPSCLYLTRLIMSQYVMPGTSPKQISLLRGTLQQRLILLAIMLPLYNILLNVYGALLGERAMARRMTRRTLGRLLPL